MLGRLTRRLRRADGEGGRDGADRPGGAGDKAHLVEFARTRRGVEAFVEPPTAMTPTTVVFVAADGEWTRRRVPDAQTLHKLANTLGIPSYDAAVVGYPQRMRAWSSARAREAKERERARRDGELP